MNRKIDCPLSAFDLCMVNASAGESMESLHELLTPSG
jgi:hypothetical protein